MKLEREQPYRVMKDHGQFKKGDVVIVMYNDETFAVVSPVMKGGRFAVPVEVVAPKVVIKGPGQYHTRGGLLVNVYHKPGHARYCWAFKHDGEELVVAEDGYYRTPQAGDDDMDIVRPKSEPACDVVIDGPGWYRTRDTRLVEVKPHKDEWFAVYDLGKPPYTVDKYGSAGTLGARFDIVAKAVKRPVITGLGTYALRDGIYARIEVQQGDSFLVNAGPHGSYWVAADGRVNHRMESRYDVVSGPIANVHWFDPPLHVNVERVWTLNGRNSRVREALDAAKRKIHEHYRFNPEQAHHFCAILDKHFKDLIK